MLDTASQWRISLCVFEKRHQTCLMAQPPLHSTNYAWYMHIQNVYDSSIQECILRDHQESVYLQRILLMIRNITQLKFISRAT